MAPLADPIDIVVADGGSTDGSLALDSLDAFRLRALLVKRGPGKLSAQMRMAIAFALGEGYEGWSSSTATGKTITAPFRGSSSCSTPDTITCKGRDTFRAGRESTRR